MDRKDALRAIAQEHLSYEGQCDVEEHLACGREDLVVIFLLGGLDGACERGTISDEEARKIYELLEVNLSDASKLRQRRALQASR